MKSLLVCFSTLLLLSCQFRRNQEKNVLSPKAKRQLEAALGEKFNADRAKLGMKEIPGNWTVAFHEENYIYYTSYGPNSMKHRGFVGKEVEYDNNLKITRDIDVYSSGKFVESNKYEDGDFNAVSFIYDFRENEYLITSQNCPECDSLLGIPWSSGYEGYKKKLDEIFDAWNLEKSLR